MNYKKSVIAPALTVAVGMTLLAGCADKETGANGTPATGSQTGSPQATQTAAKEPFKLSVMNVFYDAEPPKADSEALKVIEEYTNTDLNITWVPGSAYNDKLNVTLASGDLPMVVTALNVKDSAIINAMRSGMFWEVGPYLKDYPNLSKLNANVLNNVSVDGKIYGVYRFRPIARNGITFRKDWLDNLGLQEPKTLDELYNVIKAFTLNDPDKNGNADTYGLTEGDTVATVTVAQIAGFLGAPNTWDMKDGQFTPAQFTQEYKQALQFMKRLYDEKLMNNDFAIVKTPIDNINAGKAGMIFQVVDNTTSKHNDLYKKFPQAKLDVLSRFQGPKGERIIAAAGHAGEFLFPKSSVKTEADLRKALDFFDKMADQKMVNLQVWGIEGKHYKLENGKAIRTDEKTYSSEIVPFGQFRTDDWFNNNALEAGNAPELNAKVNKMLKENTALAVFNPAEPLISATFTERGKDLTSILNDASIKYIMGEIDDKGWDKAVEQWKANGGSKVMEELAKEYAKIAK
ncbi:MAG: ytcQ 2 [Paenibacillaceae bacterium]|jgi:putative aldouronate transport system substrate-binding protein|nr:ytcQ 2 [Paenibacillaceae bacterium]